MPHVSALYLRRPESADIQSSAFDRPQLCVWEVNMSATEELARSRLLKDMQETQNETQRQLSQLQRDVAAGQSEATKKVVQKLEEEKTAVFNKRGNKIQFRFNKLLDNRFENALDELQKIPISEEESTSGSRKEINTAVTAARVELTEGRFYIARRQKRIKIADRSEFGWTTVELYKHDELASDSADEKKLDKVEKEVEKRVAKEGEKSLVRGPRRVRQTHRRGRDHGQGTSNNILAGGQRQSEREGCVQLDLATSVVRWDTWWPHVSRRGRIIGILLVGIQ